MKRLHLLIRGKVQDVSYRYFTKKKAEEFNIKGWVRNNPDGSVEVMADGEEDTLKKFLEECRKGPSSADVESVDVEWLEPEHEFEQFVMY